MAWDEVEGENPYKQVVKAEKSVAAESEISRAVGEVQAQVVIAKKFPRDVVKAMDAILAECDIPQLAEVAIYTYPKGKTQVEGPSIRLAEVIKRCWGNMVSGVVELDRRGDESTMLAYAWDLENNIMERREFKVRHWRDTRDGGHALTDERDIYEIGANSGARRERACILSCIPGHVVNAAVARCRKTIELGMGDLSVAITKMVESFKALGVEQIQIERMLHHRIDTTSAAEMVHLRGIYAAIKDNYGKVEDFFEPLEQPEKPQQTKKATAELAKAAAAKAAANLPPPMEPIPVYEPPQQKVSSPLEESMAKLKGLSDKVKAEEKLQTIGVKNPGFQKVAPDSPAVEQEDDGLGIF